MFFFKKLAGRNLTHSQSWDSCHSVTLLPQLLSVAFLLVVVCKQALSYLLRFTHAATSINLSIFGAASNNRSLRVARETQLYLLSVATPAAAPSASPAGQA